MELAYHGHLGTDHKCPDCTGWIKHHLGPYLTNCVDYVFAFKFLG